MRTIEALIDRWLTDLAARSGYDVNDLYAIYYECIEDGIDDDFFEHFEGVTMEHDW